MKLLNIHKLILKLVNVCKLLLCQLSLISNRLIAQTAFDQLTKQRIGAFEGKKKTIVEKEAL